MLSPLSLKLIRCHACCSRPSNLALSTSPYTPKHQLHFTSRRHGPTPVQGEKRRPRVWKNGNLQAESMQTGEKTAEPGKPSYNAEKTGSLDKLVHSGETPRACSLPLVNRKGRTELRERARTSDQGAKAKHSNRGGCNHARTQTGKELPKGVRGRACQPKTSTGLHKADDLEERK